MSDYKKCAITETNKDVVHLLNAYSSASDKQVEILKCKKTGLVYVNEEKRKNESFAGATENLTEEEWNKEFPDGLDVYANDAWGETYQNTKDVYTWQYNHVADFVGKQKLDEQGTAIAEIGSARGYLLKRLEENHPTVKAIGVEPSPVMGKIARSNGLDMRTGVFDDIAFEPGSLDAVVGFGCFIQVRDPLKTLQEFNRSLKMGGKVLLDSPNSDSLFRLILLFFSRRKGLAKTLGFSSFLEKGIDLAYNPDRFYFYSPKTYSLLLEKAGFEVVQIKKRQPRYVIYGKHQLGFFKGILVNTISFLEKLTGKQAWVEVGAVKVKNV